MSETARDRILARLRNAPRPEFPRPPSAAPPSDAPARGERAARLKSRMEAVRAEVHLVPSETWLDRLKEILAVRKVATLLYAPQTAIGEALRHAWDTDAASPELVAYAGPVETFKERLFAVEAAVTAAAGAVADTGALILRPTAEEPRLMSLVPPIHIAVLRAEDIFASLEEYTLSFRRLVNLVPGNGFLVVKDIKPVPFDTKNVVALTVTTLLPVAPLLLTTFSPLW